MSGYPPPYTESTRHPSAPAGYPPAPGGYPPSQGGYPTSQGGYLPSQGGYPPSQEGYPPPQGGYPPPQGGYPPAAVGFQPQPGYNPGYGGYPSAPSHTQGYQPSPQSHSVPPQGYLQPGGYISQQPTATGVPPGGWMSVPQARPVNCPPGLEYLMSLDQIMIKQKVELLEALVGFETNNKFTIKNSRGEKMFHAVEINDCCMRNFCGPARPFDMKILDMYGNEVIHLERPLACQDCCFPCCLQTMRVYSPPGSFVGSIEQEWSICVPNFVIKNGAGDVVLRISGPLCQLAFCPAVEFDVLSKDGETEVGRIAKEWSGLLREMFTDADHFGVTFPVDLDVRMKAVMLGATFLIDFMYFEKTNN